MAVSVNDVYQKVLAIANKEQRGYITPQEFNLFADHAQKEIFRQYFHDLNQVRRGLGNNTAYADIATGIEEKISMFELFDVGVGISGSGADLEIPASYNVYKLTALSIEYSLGGLNTFTEAEQVQIKEINAYNNSPLIGNSYNAPYYAIFSDIGLDRKIRIYPQPLASDLINISYIRKPLKPNWTYVISGESALFNEDVNAGFQNFELHSSEEGRLVYKILKLAGFTLKATELIQGASDLEQLQTQQEKQ
jgi:hypothetical protein